MAETKADASKILISVDLKKNAERRDRTADARIFSPALYQLSYLGEIYNNLSFRKDFAESCEVPHESCGTKQDRQRHRKYFFKWT